MTHVSNVWHTYNSNKIPETKQIRTDQNKHQKESKNHSVWDRIIHFVYVFGIRVLSTISTFQMDNNVVLMLMVLTRTPTSKVRKLGEWDHPMSVTTLLSPLPLWGSCVLPPVKDYIEWISIPSKFRFFFFKWQWVLIFKFSPQTNNCQRMWEQEFFEREKR